MSTKRCKRRRSFVALFALASAAVPPSPARAQGTDQAAARTLFNEGRDLLKAGDYAAACPRLEAAAALYPGPGVLLNLGDCYEHTHRTASAWAEFSAAEAASSRAGREDTALEASHRKQAAEQRLCRLLIRSASRQAGLSIERDHVRVDAGAWGMAIPVDPGEHLVAAAAPGRLPWSIAVRADEPGTVVLVDVPTLQPLPRDRTQSTTYGWTASQDAAAVTCAAGVLAAGVAGALAIAAKVRENQAGGETFPAQHDDSVTAVREGNVASGLAIGGAVVAVLGTVLWLTAPRAVHLAGSAQGAELRF